MIQISKKMKAVNHKDNLFGWIKIEENNEYFFLEEPPLNCHKINGYLIEKADMYEIINELKNDYYLSSLVNLNRKSDYLSRVQKLIKEKNLRKSGWNELPSYECVYSKNVYVMSLDELDMFDDTFLDVIFLISSKKISDAEYQGFIESFDFLNQPSSLGSFYPTERTINSIISNNIAIIYLRRMFCDNRSENTGEERDIFVCYVPK